MGFFDFIRNAGEDNVAKATKTVEVAPERLDQLRKDSIQRKLASLGDDASQVTVDVKGEVATLTGSAPSQAAMEKAVLCAGNQFGIGQVDCQVEVAAATPAPAAGATGGAPAAPASAAAQPASTFYTVAAGDTLSKIAKQQYGDANKYNVIFEANKPMLSDPNKIYPGQALRIPAL